MAIQKTEKIWHNGKLIPWDAAQIHVMSHVVNYGSSVFEGVRCYSLPSGPAIFRAPEHMQRLLDSAKVYRIDVDYTREELVSAILQVVKNNGVWPCYIRPIVLRGYGEAGVNPFNSPTEVYICNYPWGKYLGTDAEQGVDICISSWTRIAPNTLPAMAKSGANYMNSQLIKMEAIVNGYAEGIALDAEGGNAFYQYQVPAAVITLKQGFGRLIRSLRDRGLLVLLDNRILKKAYGKVFLESLPDYRRTTALQDVEEFFGVN